MSYDLYFRVSSGRDSPSVESLEDYFRRRPHYTLGNGQAIYENEDTAIYFLFDVGEGAESGADESSVDDGSVPVPLAFNLNYNRPSVFALEAEPELAALVSAFDLLVDDPQEGMADGTYTRDGFLEGWRRGNRLTTDMVASQVGSTPYRLPAADLERHRQWNLAVPILQNAPTAVSFVPHITYIEEGGQIRSCVVWTDASPIALPAVDRVICYRRDLAPRRLFSRDPDCVVVPMDALEPLLVGAEIQGDPFPHRLLLESASTRAFVAALKGASTPSVVALDHILDAESVATA